MYLRKGNTMKKLLSLTLILSLLLMTGCGTVNVTISLDETDEDAVDYGEASAQTISDLAAVEEVGEEYLGTTISLDVDEINSVFESFMGLSGYGYMNVDGNELYFSKFCFDSHTKLSKDEFDEIIDELSACFEDEPTYSSANADSSNITEGWIFEYTAYDSVFTGLEIDWYEDSEIIFTWYE